MSDSSLRHDSRKAEESVTMVTQPNDRMPGVGSNADSRSVDTGLSSYSVMRSRNAAHMNADAATSATTAWPTWPVDRHLRAGEPADAERGGATGAAARAARAGALDGRERFQAAGDSALLALMLALQGYQEDRQHGHVERAEDERRRRPQQSQHQGSSFRHAVCLDAARARRGSGEEDENDVEAGRKEVFA